MTTGDLYVHPDIRHASTLPSSIYADIDLYRLSLEKVFAKSWQVIDLDIHQQLSVYPFILLPGALDEPLVLIRKNQEWICRSNVCTHRGNILVTSPGNYTQLVCGYHGRCFDLSGKLKSMPGFEGVEGFPSSADDLVPLPLEKLGPIFFTGLSPEKSFQAVLQPLLDRMSWFPFDQLTYVPHLSNIYEVDVHWALYCENYLEGFHIPFVHEKLNRALKFSEYRTDIYDFCNLQLGVAREGEVHFELPENHQDSDKNIMAYYWWIFPNTMINIYTWGVSLNIVKPKGLNKTEIVFKTFLLPGVNPDPAISDDLNNTEMEDEAIVKNVQTGVKSRFYTRGRFSPQLEPGVHHFQRLMVDHLSESVSPEK